MRVVQAARFALLSLTLALAAGLAVSAPTAAAAPACWQQVLFDWRAGKLDGYPVACYREALRRMPQDLEIYSTAPDDIRRALASHVTRRPAVRRVSAAVAGFSAAPADPLWPKVLLGGLGVFVVVVVPAGVAVYRVRSARR